MYIAIIPIPPGHVNDCTTYYLLLSRRARPLVLVCIFYPQFNYDQKTHQKVFTPKSWWIRGCSLMCRLFEILNVMNPGNYKKVRNVQSERERERYFR